jgi:hypothetical protein
LNSVEGAELTEELLLGNFRKILGRISFKLEKRQLKIFQMQ